MPAMLMARTSGPEPEPFTIVMARLHLLAPVPMGEIPGHGVTEAGVEVVTRPPSQLRASLRRVDRIPAIVPGPIRHEGFERTIARHALQPRVGHCWIQRVERIAQSIDHLEIRPLVV